MRPRMTAKVRRGLIGLAELGRVWLEADMDDADDNASGTFDRRDVSDMRAALDFVHRGGLTRPTDAQPKGKD